MKRPSGITFLAVLYMLGALLVLGLQVFTWQRTLQAVAELGSVVVYAYLSAAIFAILQLVASIGMWQGKRWGWWLGALVLFLVVARAINALVAIPVLLQQVGPPETGLALEVIKYAGRAILYGFLIRYFFTDGVEAYFDVAAIPGRKRFAYLVGVTAVVMLLMSIVVWIFGINPL